jgi:hypothetical protein
MYFAGWPNEFPKREEYRSGSLLGECIMPPKKKKTPFKAGKEARRRARLGVGMPPPERLIPDKRTKPAKHKKSAAELLDEALANE